MNANWLICFALVVVSIHVIESKGFRGRSSRGSHSRNRSQGSSRGTHNRNGGHGSSRGTQSSQGSSRSSSHGSSGGSSRGSSQGHGSYGPHSYPKSPHLSGHGPGGGRYYGSYYSSPQHVYVTQYRDSGSRYDDILSGLTMYNLGRSHSHYHHHYYQDSYYRSSTVPRTQDPDDNSKMDKATCFLKIRENWHEEVMKIPCAIVSTFSNENHMTSELSQNHAISVQKCISGQYFLLDRLYESNILNKDNTTSCVNIEDPLSVKGEPIEAENKECLVEIRTKDRRIENNMDCKVLLKYSKMPVPPMIVTVVLPQREKLKAMLNKPPWWLSLFIAV